MKSRRPNLDCLAPSGAHCINCISISIWSDSFIKLNLLDNLPKSPDFMLLGTFGLLYLRLRNGFKTQSRKLSEVVLPGVPNNQRKFLNGKGGYGSTDGNRFFAENSVQFNFEQFVSFVEKREEPLQFPPYIRFVVKKLFSPDPFPMLETTLQIEKKGSMWSDAVSLPQDLPDSRV